MSGSISIGRRRLETLLLLGALAGLGAAIGQVFFGSAERYSNDAAAVVNGVPIPLSRYQTLVELIDTERVSSLTAEDREYVLERLIDEEVLVQRGLEIGLARSDPRVRAALVNAMIEWAVSPANRIEPSDRELEAFYESAKERFSVAPRIRFRYWTHDPGESGGQAGAVLKRAGDRLEAGEPLSLVEASYPIHRHPIVELPLFKLRDYVGADAVTRMADASPGMYLGPITYAGESRLIQVIAFGGPAASDDWRRIRGEVEQAFLKHRQDAALREYLDALKGETEILRGDRPSS